MASLIKEASYDKRLVQGVYIPLAGVSKPLLDNVKDNDITQVSQVQTLVFSADLVTGNKINGKVGGIAITEVLFATSNAATLAAIANAILTANSNILSAVSNGTDTIEVTTKPTSNPQNLTDWLVTEGASQATAAITETVVPVILSRLESGVGIVLASDSSFTLATDNETHIVVGSHLNLIDGTYMLEVVDKLKGAVPCVKKGLVRVACKVRIGEVIVKGDSVAFQSGLLVKKTTETNYYTVDEIEYDDDSNVALAQISFE